MDLGFGTQVFDRMYSEEKSLTDIDQEVRRQGDFKDMATIYGFEHIVRSVQHAVLLAVNASEYMHVFRQGAGARHPRQSQLQDLGARQGRRLRVPRLELDKDV